MNKLLTTVLMFSAMATIVPAQAMETDSQKQATTPSHQAQSQYKKGHQSFLHRHKKKALATAVVLGAAATATYLYGTTAGLTDVVQRLCDSSYKFIMPVAAVPSVSPELNYWEMIANWGMPAKMIAIPAPQPSYWQSMYSYLPS